MPKTISFPLQLICFCMYKHSNTKGQAATACAANKEELPMPEALENQHRCGWIPPLLLHNGTQELTGVTALSQEMRIGHSERLLSSRSLKHLTVATVCVNKLNCCSSFRKHCEWHVWIQLKELRGLAHKGRLSSVSWAYSHTMGHGNYTAITFSNNVCSDCMQGRRCEPVLLFHGLTLDKWWCQRTILKYLIFLIIKLSENVLKQIFEI